MKSKRVTVLFCGNLTNGVESIVLTVLSESSAKRYNMSDRSLAAAWFLETLGASKTDFRGAFCGTENRTEPRWYNLEITQTKVMLRFETVAAT